MTLTRFPLLFHLLYITITYTFVCSQKLVKLGSLLRRAELLKRIGGLVVPFYREFKKRVSRIFDFYYRDR